MAYIKIIRKSNIHGQQRSASHKCHRATWLRRPGRREVSEPIPPRAFGSRGRRRRREHLAAALADGADRFVLRHRGDPRDRHVEGLGEPGELAPGRVADTALDRGEIGRVQPGVERERFDGEATANSQPADGAAELGAGRDGHRAARLHDSGVYMAPYASASAARTSPEGSIPSAPARLHNFVQVGLRSPRSIAER